MVEMLLTAEQTRKSAWTMANPSPAGPWFNDPITTTVLLAAGVDLGDLEARADEDNMPIAAAQRYHRQYSPFRRVRSVFAMLQASRHRCTAAIIDLHGARE